MRVLILNGSHRKRPGFTASMLEAFAEGVSRGGGAAETIALASIETGACVACEACQASGAGRCAIAGDDGTQRVFDAMRAADVIVYASPVYAFAPSSLLKRVVERFYALGRETDCSVTPSGLLFHEVDRGICGKPFVAVVTAANSERETMRPSIAWWRAFSRFLDAPRLGTLIRGGSSLIRSGKAAITMAEARDGFRRAGFELAAHGRISRAAERAVRRSALPVPAFAVALLKPFRRGRELLAAKAKRTLGA